MQRGGCDFGRTSEQRQDSDPRTGQASWVSVAKELGKSSSRSRPRWWEAGKMPGLPWSCMWPWQNEGFVPTVSSPTLLGNPTPPSSWAPPSFLSGPGGRKETAFVLRWSRQSPGRPEPAIHLVQRWKWHFPCWDRALQTGSPMGGQKPPKGSHLSRMFLGGLGVHALSGPPSPPGPREEAGCHGICHHATCLAWSLTAGPQVARGHHLEWKVERKPFAMES